jgi:hypothetical protein
MSGGDSACYLASTMRCCWFAVTLLFTLPSNAQTTDPWLVVPGESVGPITAQTVPADLARLFRAAKIQERVATSGGDAGQEWATEINWDNPEATLTVFWGKYDGEGLHPAAAAHPTSISLCFGNGNVPKTCKWHLANHISFGTSLRELERLNGRPFQLAGFEWDQSGTVTDWNDGDLQEALNSCGQVLIRLQPRFTPNGWTAQQQKLYEQVMGDDNFASTNPAMQRLNPVVYAIKVKLPASGNCPAS